MSLNTWRSISASMMLFVLSGWAAQVSAQDCPHCQGSGEETVYVSPDAGYVGSESYGACQGGACQAGGASGYGCPGSRCNWRQPYTENSQPDVFYNLYQPNNFGAAAAAYPAPYPTPNLVGHTYYTYQPLMPHEFLYHHNRTYHQYYNNGMGLNRTSVRWYGTPIQTTLKGIHKALSFPH